PRRLAALAADDHQDARVHRRLALQDAALDVALRIWARVLADEVDALDDRPPLRGVDAQDAGLAAPVLPRQHDDGVVLLDVRAGRPALELHAQSTSGSRESTFMKFFPRSSRATGPKMRVPIGSPASLIR